MHAGDLILFVDPAKKNVKRKCIKKIKEMYKTQLHVTYLTWVINHYFNIPVAMECLGTLLRSSSVIDIYVNC